VAAIPLEGETSRQKDLYRWYVVGLLLLIYSLNNLDRSVINILAQAIKTDLGLSDTQLGLLTGASFAVFYSIMGLPIARLADRTHRVNVVTASLAAWSVLTAACGVAANYVSLFLIRVGVGVGEAGGTPPSQSIIADYFPHAQRSTAIALFNAGVPLGTFLGFLIGGVVNDWLGWRWAFVIAGLPGVLIAVVLKLTVREPVRGQVDGLEKAAERTPPMGQTLKRLFARRSYIRVVVAASFAIGVMFVCNAWLPPLFIRVHAMSAAEVGGWMALTTGLGGFAGSLGFGWLADRLKRRYPRAEVWLPALTTALTAPFVLIVTLSDDMALVLVSMFFLFTLGYAWIGPTSSTIHRVVPVRTRALAIGFMLALSNVTANAFGPPLIGLVSDTLQPRLGDDALRYALACAALSSLIGAAIYLWAARYLLQDARTNEDPDAH